MRLTLLTAATALIATTSASSIINLSKREKTAEYNATCNGDAVTAKIVNRCPYDVYIWSIEKQLGCSADAGLKLSKGAFYNENLRKAIDEVGVSIKISKYEECGGHDLTQLEYFVKDDDNFHDISFVDCTSGDCPGWHDGFYFKTGNEGGAYTSATNNEHCPVFSVNGPEEAAKVAYVKWDDRQTKWCDARASMEFYLCGSEAPGDEPSDVPSTPSSIEEAAPSSTEAYEQPFTTETPAYTPADTPAYTPEMEVAAAEITSAPAQQPNVNIKTEVVYTTVYVKEKRHAHGHRHQRFRA